MDTDYSKNTETDSIVNSIWAKIIIIIYVYYNIE